MEEITAAARARTTTQGLDSVQGLSAAARELTSAQGLTSAQVAGAPRNDVPRRSSRSLSAILRANVFTLFNLVIGVLWALILIFGEWQDSMFGLVIVANALIGIVQELRAKRTLDKLAVINEAPVRVRRDGTEQLVEPRQVVLGDLILLGSGDRLLVDGEVIESDGLEVDESLLTGEADPVAKQPGDPVLSGSFAVAGAGAFVATKVGTDAYAVRLAEEASKFHLAHSELREGVANFIRYLTWLVIPIGVLLIFSQLANSTDFRTAITGAVAGIVTMIPEGLVLMTSIAFAVGVIRLARHKCLVQELPAVEGLARVDVLCLDKTGTLTAGGMDLDQVLPVGDDQPVDAALAALAHLDHRPNTTAQALQTRYPAPEDSWTATETVPFSSARKWSGADFGEHGAWVLGAPDVLLDGGDCYDRAADLAATGARVLVLCRTDRLTSPEDTRSTPTNPEPTTPRNTDPATPEDAEPTPPRDTRPLPDGIEPVALVTLKQSVRPDARETLRYFAQQGVTVKIISGDNPAAVSAIATSLGVPGGERSLDARTLPHDRDELGELLDSHTVFGRVSPRQKREFVAALRARGHTVAMTGDGVNDVLALKDADLGIAMGAGSPATKAVAQVVLLDNKFATLPHVVGEGRRVLANIERVANLFLAKTFYAIVLSLVVGVAGMMFPFAPRHSTLTNALTIGIPALFLALAPTFERSEPGFVRRVLRFAVPAGVLCAAAVLLSFWAAHSEDSTLVEDQTAAVIALFLTTWWVLVLIARPLNWGRIVLVGSMAALFAIALALPFVRELFALRPQDLGSNLTAVGISIVAAAAISAAVKVAGTLRT
ncbi:HAD-IC family P-type ATPase [Nonomuraea jiangxiensis]|uniref:Cation-transporting ATPase E n=1 Tax=Nonomuraea jiangxiensis TaxID=633440 RepID=A0A1G9W5A6_9ACTN|nr:HAD-IC family P-type ATPase [Nonomuraea jiangxiensis]SDM79714.1 cation-transporting ATPase E [Nonomuraea jiangxiensis]